MRDTNTVTVAIIVPVPDIPHLTKCWRQCLVGRWAMWRCTHPKGHDGLHTWETADLQGL